MKKIYLITLLLIGYSGISQETVIATIAYQGYEEDQAFFGQGEYEIFLDNVDAVLDKPIVLMDGFDPGDNLLIDDMYSLLDFDGGNMADILRDLGYDVVILNFPVYITDATIIDGGSDYIQRNAFVLVELLNIINDQKVGDEELVVLGPSVGGLVSRYALSYMEQNSIPHETRLYISFDTPHYGANLPISFQYLINYFAKAQDIPEAQELIDTLLNSPVAKEILIDHFTAHLEDGSDYEQDPSLLLPAGAPDFRDAFQAELDALGFPSNIRNVAIVNGSGISQTTGTPGMEILNTTIDLGGGVTIDLGIHFTPDAGESINITSFESFFFGIPVTTFEADAQSPAESAGFDSTPGGTASIAAALGDGGGNPIIIEIIESLAQDEFSFVPVLSSLAIENEDDWYASPDIGGIHTSPFVNAFIPDVNEPHLSLTPESVEFALEEILNPPLSNGDFNLSDKYILIENPVSEVINIGLDRGFLYENVELSVYSISGQKIYFQKFENPRDEILLNASFAKGMFILNIIDSEGSYTKKFFVK